MRRRAGLVSLLLLAAAWAPAAASAAAPPAAAQLRQARALAERLAPRSVATHAQDTHPRPTFVLHVDGYWIKVVGSGERVAVEVAKQARHGAAVSAYFVRGTVTRGRLRANFGKLGAVDMRFRPAANRTWPPSDLDCSRHHRLQDRRGVFVGGFRFRGEGGYVTVAAHRVKGLVREIAPRCLHGRPRARLARGAVPHTGKVTQNPERGYLFASRQQGVTSASLLALKTKRGRTELFADTQTSRGRMAIVRAASLVGGRRALRLNDALTSGRLAGPAPISGAAKFAAAPDGTRTWRGGLTIDFPGLAAFPLAGPEYEVHAGRSADPFFLLFLLLS